MLKNRMNKLGLVVFCLLTACAINKKSLNPQDPFEPFNRQAFQFNQNLDKAIFKPLATVYKKVTPWFVRDAITNFYYNIMEVPNVANDLLQVNFYQALHDAGRFAFNTTYGLGGLVDVATPMGIKHHTQDFGLTLARWGWKDSAYLVLPFFGSRTVRDTISMTPDYYLSLYPYALHSWKSRYFLIGLDYLNYRAMYLGTENIVQQAAVDEYIFIRDAYLQKRTGLIQHNDNAGPEHDTNTRDTRNPRS